MKNLALVLSGAALAAAAFALVSAVSPSPSVGDVPSDIGKGRVVTGFSVLPGSLPVLAGLDDNTPVTIRDVEGTWIEIDYPTQRTGPVWINTNLVVSFRVER